MRYNAAHSAPARRKKSIRIYGFRHKERTTFARLPQETQSV
jgi:hypothetical protein